MSTSVELSGDALYGIDGPKAFPLMTPGPETVRLGAVLRPAPAMAPLLSDYIENLAALNLPAETRWREKAGASLNRMYLNDRFGCCVISGKHHALGVTSSNDSDSGGTILATDDEVHAQYRQICGHLGNDAGCIITEVLDVMRTRGITAGGRAQKIDGYVRLDWTNWDMVRAALFVFGNLTVGFNLPRAWTQSATWDLVNSPNAGGHDVTIVDYDPEYVYASSWGRVYRWTRRAFCSRQYVSECYAVLYPQWYNADRLAPSGFNVDRLRADLDKLGRGVLPDDPPAPSPPPSAGEYRVTVAIDRATGAARVVT